MSALSIQPTFPIFTETDGQPLENGYIWIGAVNLDPQVNPINVYWDAALTISAPQPIRTINGYPSRNGTPGRLYVNSDYSIRVMNSKGSMVYNAPAATERYGNIVNAGNLQFSQADSYPVGTVGKKLQQIVCPMDAPYSASGDGVSDDTIAIQAAIASGAPIIDLAGKSYLLNNKLLFDQIGQTFRDGTFIFDGDNTQRIGDVTADDVTFINVTFDGNNKQPRSAAVWINDDVQRPKFHSCTFKDLTGRNWGTGVLNAMYAVLISPYGVTNFEFRDCLFQNLIKYNDGINTIPVTPAFVGGGFVGGVCFLPENLNPGVTAQTVITQGTIEGCTFDNIQTIRAAGLSVSDQIEFNDADAIRTYGDANTPSLHVHVSDCIFKRVSKRCFKFRADGSVAYDNECYATDLPYPMVSPIDLTSNCRVVNLAIQASVALPVYNAVTWSVGPVVNREALIQGLFVSHCKNGVVFFSDPSNSDLENFVVRDCFFNQCYDAGVFQTAPIPTTMRNIVIEDTQIYGATDNTLGISIAGSSNVFSGIKIDNVYLLNASVAIVGVDNDIRNLTLEVSSNTFSAQSASSPLFRLGVTGFGGFQNVENLFINAWNLDPNFLSVTRQNLINIIGDNGTFKNVRIKVPQTLDVTYAHADTWGREMNFDGLQYDGAGRIHFGTQQPLVRGTIQNAVRMSNNGGTCSESFLYTSNAGTTQVALMNITDLRPTTASSIIINNGTQFIVYNVASKTSNGTIVQNGGLAKTANINTF